MIGRPRGSRDLYGNARRVDVSVLPSLAREIGRRVRDARLERSISVAELAAATKAHRRTIHAIESGRGSARNLTRSPKIATVIRIALALGVMPSELMP